MKQLALIRSVPLNIFYIIAAIGIFIGFLISILNPFVVLAGIAALFVIFQIFNKPEKGIYVSLAYIPLHLFLMTQPFVADIKVGPFFVLGAIKDSLLFLVVFIGTLKFFLKKNNRRIFYSEINKPLYVFLLIGALHLLTSNNLFLGLSAYRYWAEFSTIFFLTPLMINKQKHIKPIFPIIILGGISALAFGTYQHFTGELYARLSNIGTYFYVGRLTLFSRDFSSANTYGIYMGIIFICCVAFLLFGSLSKKNRTILFAIIPVALINIIFTFSRRSILGVLLILLFYLWYSKLRRSYVIVVFIFFISIVFSSSLVVERLQTVFQLYEPSTYARFEEWSFLLNRWIEHPVWGLGLGMVGPASILFEVTKGANVHNSYFIILIQIGIFGLAPFLWFLYKIIAFGMSLIKKIDESILKPHLFATLGCVLFLLFVSLFGTSLDTYPTSLFFWFFAGLLISIGRMVTDVKPLVGRNKKMDRPL